MVMSNIIYADWMHIAHASLLNMAITILIFKIMFFFQNPGGGRAPPQNHSGGGTAPPAPPLATPLIAHSTCVLYTLVKNLLHSEKASFIV